MDIINHLKETYGYGTPIFLKDIRIGGKSKTAIRQELSRATKRGEIIRKCDGVYYFKEEANIGGAVTFDMIVEKRFIKNDYFNLGLDFDVYGYFTGGTFLNQIGLSQQVPAIDEIVTNHTSCKRYYKIGRREVLLRPAKVYITFFNYKALQFFDMFYYLEPEEVEACKDIIKEYARKYVSKDDFDNYIRFFDFRIIKVIIEKGIANAFK